MFSGNSILFKNFQLIVFVVSISTISMHESYGATTSLKHPLLTTSAEGTSPKFIDNDAMLFSQYQEYLRQRRNGLFSNDLRKQLRDDLPNGGLGSILQAMASKYNFDEIRHLTMRYTNITDVAPLAQLKNLRVLYLGNYQKSKNENTRKMSGTDFAPMTDITLKNMASLVALKNLDDLRIYGVNLDNYRFLKKLKRLSLLILDGTNITPAQAKEVQEALPMCDVRYTNIIRSEDYLFGALMKKYNRDLRLSLLELSKRVDLERINWVKLEKEVRNIEAISLLPNLTEASLHQLEISSVEPIFNLPHLERIHVGIMVYPGGTTKQFIRKLRARNQNVKINVWLSLNDLFTKIINDDSLSVQYRTKQTLESMLAYYEREIDPSDVTTVSFSERDLDRFRKKIPGIVERFSDLKAFKNYSNVETFIATSAYFKTLKDLKHMTKLKRLELGGSSLHSLDGIENFQNLERLAITNTNVSDLTPLSALRKMSYFEFSDTVIDSLEPLRPIVSLKTILGNRSKVSNLEPLENLTNLISLELNGAPVRDLRPLSGLTLDFLDMRNTHVESIAPVLFHGRNDVMFFKGSPFEKRMMERFG